jgi:hypothetical protein
VKRTPAIEVRLGRTYECQKELCEDPKIISAWFELVKNTVDKYSILPGDTYNFDETGFQMGQISQTGQGDQSRLSLLMLNGLHRSKEYAQMAL